MMRKMRQVSNTSRSSCRRSGQEDEPTSPVRRDDTSDEEETERDDENRA